MSQVNHTESLKMKHAELEAAINEETSRPLPDDVLITQLKRHKLRIKDELAQMTH